MSIDNRKLGAMRELGPGEVAEVSGGDCQMGFRCNCPGATNQISPDGSTYQTNACDGSIWVAPLLNHAFLRTL